MRSESDLVRVTPLNLETRGYGLDGALTRGQWQDLCLTMLRAGRARFNHWQQQLQADAQNVASPPSPPSFNVEVSYLDNSRPNLRIGWSGRGDPRLVFDICGQSVDDRFIDFDGFHFRFGAIFSGVKFAGLVSFINCTFESSSWFVGCEFVNAAVFHNDRFVEMPNFEHTRFHGHCSFYETAFHAGALFNFASFENEARFVDTQFFSASFDAAEFFRDADFSARSPFGKNDLKTFGKSSFLGTRFRGRADFSNREFTGSTTFGLKDGKRTRFDLPPSFFNCKLHQATNFSDAEFSPLTVYDSNAVPAFNALRLAMSQRQSTRDEQRFLVYELDAERLATKGYVRHLYIAYKVLANYGLSLSRPILLLLLLPGAFAFLFYGLIASVCNCAALSLANCSYSPDVLLSAFEFTILQSLPPFGLDTLSGNIRSTLFGQPSAGMSVGLTLAVITQKIAALMGWFFVGLSLRNRFKMK